MGQVIETRFGVQLSKASICRLLAQWGLSPQRPVWRAYQQKPKAVQEWFEHRISPHSGPGTPPEGADFLWG